MSRQTVKDPIRLKEARPILRGDKSDKQIDLNAPDPGRPREIEEYSNLYLIHPLSRQLVRLLLPTPVTPNAVSIFGALTAFAAAACFYTLPWPTAAFAGFAFMFLTHVVDGADGRLARLSGRSTPNGEVIDGLCDHIGYAAVYISMTLVLARDIGSGPAWTIAWIAGICNILHAGSYEYRRRTYNYFIYGRPWLRNRVKTKDENSSDQIKGTVFTSIARFFLFLQNFVAADNPDLDQAMTKHIAADEQSAQNARRIYQEDGVKQVRLWSVMGQNHKTIAIFLGMLAGSPLYFFIYVITVLNLALALLILRQRRIAVDVLTELKPLAQAGT